MIDINKLWGLMHICVWLWHWRTMETQSQKSCERNSGAQFIAVWATASAAAPSVADRPHTAIFKNWLGVFMGRASWSSWRFWSCFRRTVSGRCCSVDLWKSLKLLMAILWRTRKQKNNKNLLMFK